MTHYRVKARASAVPEYLDPEGNVTREEGRAMVFDSAVEATMFFLTHAEDPAAWTWEPIHDAPPTPT